MNKATWGGKCPTWSQFLTESLNEDAAMGAQEQEVPTEPTEETEEAPKVPASQEDGIVKDDINDIDNGGGESVAMTDLAEFDKMFDDDEIFVPEV